MSLEDIDYFLTGLNMHHGKEKIVISHFQQIKKDKKERARAREERERERERGETSNETRGK